jgi:hypothetical protein
MKRTCFLIVFALAISVTGAFAADFKVTSPDLQDNGILPARHVFNSYLRQVRNPGRARRAAGNLQAVQHLGARRLEWKDPTSVEERTDAPVRVNRTGAEVQIFSLVRLPRYSFRVLAATPLKTSRPIRFGMAIKPFSTSDRVQTNESLATAPIKVAMTKRSR